MMELPLVVPKTRTRTIGAERAVTERFDFLVDLNTQGEADIHNMLIGTVEETTAEQIRAGNDPNFVLVDGRQQPVKNAHKKVEVYYGAFLQRALMSVIEIELHRAITSSTRTASGSLANIRSGWEWVLLSQGKRTILGGPQDIKTFGPGDALILSARLNYAGRVNSLVTRRRQRGFMLDAVDKLRRKTQWRAFSIKVGFSHANALPDEIQKKQGTPYIIVKMARTRYRRG